MNLFEAKLNSLCKVQSVDILDRPTKIRLMELGLVIGSNVKVIKKSILKDTLLIVFNSTCFTLKSNLAREIVVTYA